MGYFCCFQLHFFHFWRAKLGKYKKVGREMIIYILFTHLLLQPRQISASKYICYEKYEDLFYFDPQNAKKLWYLAKKRPFKFDADFNNQQIVLIFCLIFFEKILWRPHFLIFLRFCHFLAQKWQNLKENQFYEISRANISKM